MPEGRLEKNAAKVDQLGSVKSSAEPMDQTGRRAAACKRPEKRKSRQITQPGGMKGERALTF